MDINHHKTNKDLQDNKINIIKNKVHTDNNHHKEQINMDYNNQDLMDNLHKGKINIINNNLDHKDNNQVHIINNKALCKIISNL